MVKKLSVHLVKVIALFASLAVPIILKTIISPNVLVQSFVLSLLFHVVASIYFIYTSYELNFLHEKQGSKLTLSKDKLQGS